MTGAATFSTFDVLTVWAPGVALLLGLVAAGVVLAHADEVGPIGLVLTGGATAVLLLGLAVFTLDWAAP